MAVNRVDSGAIDIEVLASSIEKDMASNDYPFISPNCCIFKTPTVLSRLNERAYVPEAFSFGPFHHGKPNLTDTEKIKKKYLHGLISRSRSPEKMLRDLINSVEEVQREARECYSIPIGYNPDEFVKILVIDGCFIIELFCKEAYKVPREDNDPIFSMKFMFEVLPHDLILLENQVPWMVLERLFNMTVDPRLDECLIEMAKSFFDGFLIAASPSGNDPHIEDTKHILDLLRKLLIATTVAEEGQIEWTPMPSATSLVQAGVKIRRCESNKILDIKFINGCLEIPRLKIDELTETYFRNLISFEQCYPYCEPRFTSYAVIIDNLINTANDVNILCKNKIINNWLNPEDAVPFFNELYYNVHVKEIYYQSLCEEVNKFCQRRWPRWRAVLVRNYFNTPWAIVSTMAAVILLILSLLQTLYTMKK